MKTEQFNIRMSEDLKQDLDIISNLLRVNKSEWVRMKIAEEAYEEKNRLLMELSTLYSKGMLTTKQLESLVGREVAEEMEFIKKKAKESIKKGIEYGKRLKKRRVCI